MNKATYLRPSYVYLTYYKRNPIKNLSPTLPVSSACSKRIAKANTMKRYQEFREKQ